MPFACNWMVFIFSEDLQQQKKAAARWQTGECRNEQLLLKDTLGMMSADNLKSALQLEQLQVTMFANIKQYMFTLQSFVHSSLLYTQKCQSIYWSVGGLPPNHLDMVGKLSLQLLSFLTVTCPTFWTCTFCHFWNFCFTGASDLNLCCSSCSNHHFSISEFLGFSPYSKVLQIWKVRFLFAENPELPKILFSKPGVGENITASFAYCKDFLML